MPLITNRIETFFIFLVAGSSFLVLLSGQSFGQNGSPKSKVGSPQAKKGLTPEERAVEKQKSLQLQNETTTKRRQSFGMLPPDDKSELGKKYQEALDQFREAAVDLNHVQLSFHLTQVYSQAFRNKVAMEWQEAIQKSHRAKVNWLKVAGEIYASDPDKYESIGESLCEMLLADVELDRTDGWLEPTKAIVNSKKFEREELLRSAGLIGYANSDFDFTEECLTRAQKFHPDEPQSQFMAEIVQVREKWKRELEIRQREAEKNDNPRVEFNTSKGRIVMELYEDSAPETVKSFIYLVQDGFFSRKTFFRVEKHVCAQTGCEKGDGTGDAGYIIPSEMNNPNHRDHFRGAMSLALGTDRATGQSLPDSGSSQFFFSFLPMPQLDGIHTVFGRIVEGLEVISYFRVMNLGEESQRKEGKEADLIISAKVLRKRDTVYKPRILAGKLK